MGYQRLLPAGNLGSKQLALPAHLMCSPPTETAISLLDLADPSPHPSMGAADPVRGQLLRSPRWRWLGKDTFKDRLVLGTHDTVSWGAKGQEAALGGRVNAKQGSRRQRRSLAGEPPGLAGAGLGSKSEGGEGLPSGEGGRQESSNWRKHQLGCECPENRKQNKTPKQWNMHLYCGESMWAEKKNGRRTRAPKGTSQSWVPPPKKKTSMSKGNELSNTLNPWVVPGPRSDSQGYHASLRFWKYRGNPSWRGVF